MKRFDVPITRMSINPFVSEYRTARGGGWVRESNSKSLEWMKHKMRYAAYSQRSTTIITVLFGRER